MRLSILLFNGFTANGFTALDVVGGHEVLANAPGMAALLAGEEVKKTSQPGIEYYPCPPFSSGTPDLLRADRRQLVAAVERGASGRLAARRIPF